MLQALIVPYVQCSYLLTMLMQFLKLFLHLHSMLVYQVDISQCSQFNFLSHVKCI